MATRLVGAKRLQDALKAMGPRMQKASGAGLYALGNEMMTDSKEMTPVDLGPLKASGYVSLPVERGKKTLVEIGYGGPAKDYAIPQHENLSYHHEVGEAKFLEKGINKNLGARGRQIVGIAAEAAFLANSGAQRNPGMPTNPDDDSA